MSQTVSLRRVADCLDSRRIPLNREDRSNFQGSIPYWGAGGILDHVEGLIFNETLVLLGEDGAPFFDARKDVAYLVSGPAWVNNHIHVLRPRNVDPSFLCYTLNSIDYSRYITGATRDKLTQDDMLRIHREGPSGKTIPHVSSNRTSRVRRGKDHHFGVERAGMGPRPGLIARVRDLLPSGHAGPSGWRRPGDTPLVPKQA